MNPADEPFHTQEAILAFCLDIAGCEFADPNRPCINLFDADILGKLSYRGKPLWEGAQEAWKDARKGHVEYVFRMTPRLLDLVRAYREQAAEIEKPGGNATAIVIGLLGAWKSGAILDDEALLRIACVNLKTRIDFVNIWKAMVPMLRVQRKGKSTTTEGTASVPAPGGTAKIVPSRTVKSPGWELISLNASPELRKAMKL